VYAALDGQRSAIATRRFISARLWLTFQPGDDDAGR
jgi:hypothetical protein